MLWVDGVGGPWIANGVQWAITAFAAGDKKDLFWRVLVLLFWAYSHSRCLAGFATRGVVDGSEGVFAFCLDHYVCEHRQTGPWMGCRIDYWFCSSSQLLHCSQFALSTCSCAQFDAQSNPTTVARRISWPQEQYQTLFRVSACDWQPTLDLEITITGRCHPL